MFHVFGSLLSVLFVLIALTGYFSPTIAAFTRHHQRRHAIAATNLVLGVTLVGWAAALSWALTTPQKD